MQEFKLKSYDGKEIFVTLWDDVSAPCGVIQFVHGMNEYAGRYDEFARYLNSRGYIVFADDHRGHGRTETPENRGRCKGNVFEKTLKDEIIFREWLKKRYRLPVFLAGHSYGSFICQALLQRDTGVKAVALLGSGHIHGLCMLGRIVLAPVWLVARNWRPNLNRFMTWINSVPERREQILADECACSPVSINISYSMIRNSAKLYGRRAMSRLNPTTFIALFSGDDDIVGRKGKGVRKLQSMYRDNGMICNLNLYEGARHDIVYEYCYEKVWSDIADYFDKFIIFEQATIDELM